APKVLSSSFDRAPSPFLSNSAINFWLPAAGSTWTTSTGPGRPEQPPTHAKTAAQAHAPRVARVRRRAACGTRRLPGADYAARVNDECGIEGQLNAAAGEAAALPRRAGARPRAHTRR